MVKPVSRFGDEGGPQNQKVKMIQYSDSVVDDLLDYSAKSPFFLNFETENTDET